MSRLSSAEVIATIRKATGWTQTQLAHQLALSGAQISAIENGKKQLSRRVVELLIYKLNVRRDWLEEGKGEPFDEDNPPPPPEMSRASKALVTAAVLTPFTPAVSAALALGVGANEIINKIVDAYGVRNATDLAQKVFNTSQSTVASWIRRNKVPAEVVARALQETDLTLEEILSNNGYIYIRKVDLVEIIRRMSEERELRGLKPSELSDLYDKFSGSSN